MLIIMLYDSRDTQARLHIFAPGLGLERHLSSLSGCSMIVGDYKVLIWNSAKYNWKCRLLFKLWYTKLDDNMQISILHVIALIPSL